MGFKRYTVRLAFKDKIINIITTDDYSEAVVAEIRFAKAYGTDNVWIANALTELMVG